MRNDFPTPTLTPTPTPTPTPITPVVPTPTTPATPPPTTTLSAPLQLQQQLLVHLVRLDKSSVQQRIVVDTTTTSFFRPLAETTCTRSCGVTSMMSSIVWGNGISTVSGP